MSEVDLNSNFREKIRESFEKIELPNRKIFPKWVKIKNRLQDWLETAPYTYMITIECDKKNEMSEDELKQRLRIIDYKLNKKYMLCRFTKLPLEKRIFSIGFIEKSKKKSRMETTHAHVLLFVPEYSKNSGYSKTKSSSFKTKHIALDIISSWLSIPSLKRNGKYRKLNHPHIMRIKENIRKSPPRYASKEVRFDFNSMFFNFEGFDKNNTRVFQ